MLAGWGGAVAKIAYAIEGADKRDEGGSHGKMVKGRKKRENRCRLYSMQKLMHDGLVQTKQSTSEVKRSILSGETCAGVNCAAATGCVVESLCG